MPKDFSVRTVAQEYGGEAFSISGDTIEFSNCKDQRLYMQSVGSADPAPMPLTPDSGAPVVCYVDGVFDLRFDRYVTVRENRRESTLNPTTAIVALSLFHSTSQEPKVVVRGSDFYAFPRIDPKGERLAWIQWSHPNMPWDKSELWVGYISDNGDMIERVCIAGCDPNIVESPTEPKWSSKGELFFISDRKSGFWNLYKWTEATNGVHAIYTLNAEFERPLWVFGMNSYELIHTNEERNLIACTLQAKWEVVLGIIDDAQGKFSLLDIPFTDIENISSGNNCLFVEGHQQFNPHQWLRLLWMIINQKQLSLLLFGLLHLAVQYISRVLVCQSLLSFQRKFLEKMPMHTFILQPILTTKQARMKSLHCY